LAPVRNRRPKRDPTAEDSKGTPLPKGTPAGIATTKVIGAAGGTITSADGGITFTIPAGAVSANTPFPIQPITSSMPTNLELNYRLLPEGTHFAQPVTITFHYADSLLKAPENKIYLLPRRIQRVFGRCNPKVF
jgi:hypothetical protein